MSIQDSSPERRNLLVLSIGIIVFYLAGGEFIDQSVRLQVINVHFTKPEMLMKLVWVLLFWFIYRYWVTINPSWKYNLYDGFTHTPSTNSLLYYYLIKKFELKDDFSNALYKDKHFVGLECNINSNPVFRFKNIQKSNEGNQSTNYKEVSTILDKIVCAIFAVRSFIFKPQFSNYVMPYLLATYAIVLGLYNAL